MPSFLTKTRLVILYLPTSSNPNLIELMWRFLKKKFMYNKYYEKFAVLRLVITRFLDTIDQKEAQLRTLLAENFHTMDPA
ncbi:MAG: hypothetical protein WCR39_06000 [Bacteroidales bacterium]|nr:hypothetical protein [Bacteroidales bacterium]